MVIAGCGSPVIVVLCSPLNVSAAISLVRITCSLIVTAFIGRAAMPCSCSCSWYAVRIGSGHLVLVLLISERLWASASSWFFLLLLATSMVDRTPTGSCAAVFVVSCYLPFVNIHAISKKSHWAWFGSWYWPSAIHSTCRCKIVRWKRGINVSQESA